MPEYIYGPVPSRRLGFSLGIDLIPFKTCSFDCIYCQLGKTIHQTIERKEYFPVKDIFFQLEQVLSSEQKIDYITFSGSGEPTLHSGIGPLIREIKKITPTPVAVLTNSSLLFQQEVRKELLAADLVVPSLDAADESLWKKINRPPSALSLEQMIKGLIEFRQEFKGKIWLEIMLIKGINTNRDHLQKMLSVATEIRPDKIQLNTVVRPPTEKYALPLSHAELVTTKKMFGQNCEIIAEFRLKEQPRFSKDIEQAILSTARRRPVTLPDLSFSLGLHQNEILKYLEFLISRKKIKTTLHQGLIYYELTKKENR